MSAVIDIASAIVDQVQRQQWDVRLAITGNPVVLIRQRPSDSVAFCALSCRDFDEAKRVVALARGEK